MFIQPIVDLWAGRPIAYALTDAHGFPIEASSPRELYMNIEAAFQRDFAPLVVCRPSVMKSVWDEFVKRLPEPLWLYENRQVCSERGEVVMNEDGEPSTRWQRSIDNTESMEAAIESGIRYGSGSVLMGVEQLACKDPAIYQIEWGL